MDRKAWASILRYQEFIMWSTSTQILWSQWRTNSLVRCITKWIGSSYYTTGSPRCICIQSPDKHREKLFSNWKGIACNCVRLLSIWVVRFWEKNYSIKWSPTSGSDIQETNNDRAKKFTENASFIAKVWPRNKVLTGKKFGCCWRS